MIAQSVFRQTLIFTFMFFVKIVVNTYTIISLPIYYLFQNPKRRRQIASSLRSRRLDPAEPDSPWMRVGERPYHPLQECQTICEALDMMMRTYPHDKPTIGFRDVLSEEIQRDKRGRPLRMDGKILKKFRLSEYKWLSLGEAYATFQHVAKGFYLSGIKRRDRVAMLADTCFYWLCSSIALDTIGAAIVTVFPTLGEDGIIHALNEAGVSTVVTNHEMLPILSSIASKIPKLKRIIYFDGPPGAPIEGTFSKKIHMFTMSDIKELARKTPEQIQYEPLTPDEVSFIMFTSGTTGVPKGVLANQRMAKEAGLSMLPIVKDVLLDGPRHTYVAYLPMAHILESSVQLFLLAGGVKIGYANPFTLNESAPGLADGEVCDLKLLKPTVMAGVPLVLDRIKKEMYEKLRKRTPVSTAIFNYLVNYKINWVAKGYNTPIVNFLLCRKVKEQLGNRMEFLVVGGAPLTPELQALIKCSSNLTLLQGYGATETLGAVICMDFDDMSYGRVGAPLADVKVRLVDWDEGGYTVNDVPHPRGEIVIGGPKVSLGYLNMDELTNDVFKEEFGERWFYTGDIGEVFPDGTFKIIDRRSDLIKLQNGEFISLGKIEAALKNSGLVENVCVCANSTLNFTVALVVPHLRAFEKLARQLNLGDQEIEDWCIDQRLVDAVFESMSEVGRQLKLHRKEFPIRIRLVHEMWSPDNGFLTAAMKHKRRFMHSYYEREIAELFREAFSLQK